MLRRFFLFLLGAVGGGYYAWSWYTGTGAYAAFANWMADTFGSVDDLFALYLPMMVAAIFVFGAFAPKPGAEPAAEKTPYGQARDTRNLGFGMIVLGLLALPAAWYGLEYTKGLPDGTEAPTILNLATWDGETVPTDRKVRLEGEILWDEMGSIVETFKSSTTETFYVPVIGRGQLPQNTERAFFVTFKAQSEGTNPAASLFERPGYLTQKPVDALVRGYLEEGGATVAATTYQMTYPTGGLQGYWVEVAYSVAAVGALLALAGLITLLIGAFQMRSRGRAAATI